MEEEENRDIFIVVVENEVIFFPKPVGTKKKKCD